MRKYIHGVSNNTVDSNCVILFINHHNKFVFFNSLVTCILIVFPDRVLVEVKELVQLFL
jgi:hypothetical protein